ncbi:hypothetical protein [Zhouia amylolytica]|uniref:hypothetical protein n=1 Tax=Zhouia amylolytica TaxID=376730 RepID=UPI00137B6C67|nr:hypothetical protein [Zhouia amylolytica]MCQ0112638.1 hypothetical protein [Zhouia amylolytica]
MKHFYSKLLYFLSANFYSDDVVLKTTNDDRHGIIPQLFYLPENFTISRRSVA